MGQVVTSITGSPKNKHAFTSSTQQYHIKAGGVLLCHKIWIHDIQFLQKSGGGKATRYHVPTCCLVDLQGCVCYAGRMTTDHNGSVHCEADLLDSHRNISITLLVVVPAFIVLFALMDVLGRLRRGSYDKYVKGWIKRRGAPGQPSPAIHVL